MAGEPCITRLNELVIAVDRPPVDVTGGSARRHGRRAQRHAVAMVATAEPTTSGRWMRGRLLKPEERHDHRYTAAIGSICLRAQFGSKKALLHVPLLPFAKRDQQDAKQRGPCRNRNAGGN